MNRRAVRELRDARRRTARRATALATACVVLVALVLYGAPVPRLSEELYLPLTRHVGDPSFLAGDWTHAGRVRGALGVHPPVRPARRAMPLAVFGWLGRLLSWTLLAWLLVRLGGRIGLPPMAAAAGIALWLVANQALIGGDWMFGTFEAKTVADILVVAALLAATRDRVALAIALLGVGFSLHPGLGGWAAFAGGAALLANPTTRHRALRWAPVGLLLAAPGCRGGAVVGQRLDQPRPLPRDRRAPVPPRPVLRRHAARRPAGDPARGGARRDARDERRLVPPIRPGSGAAVPRHVPDHGDHPGGHRVRRPADRRVAVPRAAAAAARAARDPARVLPPARPPRARARGARRPTARGGAGVRRSSPRSGSCSPLTVTSPLLAAPRMVERTVRAWIHHDDDADAFRWIAGHTPTSMRCVVPVDRQDAYERAQRPVVATWQAIRYDDVAGWKRRVDALVGGAGFFGARGHGGRSRRAARRVRRPRRGPDRGASPAATTPAAS